MHARLVLDARSLRQQLWLNRLQSALLLGGLSLLAGMVGLLVAGPTGLLAAALAALAMLVFAPRPGGALFRHALGGTPLPPAAAPQLHALTLALSERAGLDRPPDLYLLPAPELQAMAAGDPRASAIALTPALLRLLPAREVAAVLAHEIAHIRHGDVGVMRLAQAAAALTRAMSTLGLLLLLFWLPAMAATGQAPWPGAFLLLLAAPILGDLLTLSLSRRREYLADAGAVALTGDPAALAGALVRLERLQGDDWERLARNGPRWLRLFRTHPTIRERVDRLAATTRIARPGPPSPWLPADPVWPPPALPRHRPGQRLAQRLWL